MAGKVAQAVICAILGSAGIGLIKVGLQGVIPASGTHPWISLGTLMAAAKSPLVLVGMVVGFMGTLNYICLLAKADLAVAAPLVAAAAWVVLLAFSWGILREPVSAARVLGLVMVVGGSVILSVR